jgi:formylglycine-generating enzyme required for sulfatase activity
MKRINWTSLGLLLLLSVDVNAVDKMPRPDAISLQSFRDYPDCPEMVTIPSGSIEMGSNNDDEYPPHRVTI